MKVKASLLTTFIVLATLIVVYGQDPAASQAPSSTQSSSVDSQGIRGYLLGPGDVIDVRVFGQPEMNSVVEVDGDGNLSSLPFLDPIRAKCRTEKEVQKDIATAYAKYLKNAQISVRITERKSRPPATIFGAVRQPSQVLMLRSVRLNELISKSGGFTERASGTIQILHTEPVMCPAPGDEADAAPVDGSVPFRIVQIGDLKANKPGANPFIRPGDYISVTEAEPVYITGSVVNPTGVYMRDGLTLSTALAMVGDVRKEAKKSEIIIRRVKDHSDEREIIRVDYAAIKKNLKPDVLLKPYDWIDVPESSPFSGGRLGQTLLSGFTQAITSTASILPMRVLY
ncbi:MAG TPA: polysaccharide biosynthesis/export family protein [Pyrinomonadaceae bacterium]|jgi:polysaccharide export outer membrane protein